jgi:hypothetical protein
MQTMQNTHLRNIVLTIDAVLGEMMKAPPGVLSESSLAELKLEWAKLVDVLALGPAPDVRACPTCGRTVMRQATRCGYCWKPLPSARKNGA